ncbi:hypothetical protein [Flindersiella endophytica]
MDPGRGALRIARGGVLAAACLLLAIAGHVGGGGHLPPLPALVVTGVLIGAAFAVLADRRRGLKQLMAASLAAQVLFHAVFALAGHDQHTLLVSGAPALVRHGVASLLVAALAARADEMLWTLAGLLRRALPPPLVVVPAAPPLAAVPDFVPLASRVWTDAHSCPRRGPPPC